MKWECEFQKNAAHSDGLQNVCRECRRDERKGELKVIEKRILKLIKKMKASSYSIHGCRQSYCHTGKQFTVRHYG
jgi:hypothetical protein